MEQPPAIVSLSDTKEEEFSLGENLRSKIVTISSPVRSIFSFVIDLTGWLLLLSMETLWLGWLYDYWLYELLVPRTVKSESSSSKRKNGEEDQEQKSKRWRGDQVYLSVQDFMVKMWGTRDGNDNIAVQTSETAEADSGMSEGKEDCFWKQEPVLNFSPLKVKVQFGDGTPTRIIKDIKNDEYNEEDSEADPYEDIENGKHNEEDSEADPYEDIENDKHNEEDSEADAQEADDETYEDIKNDEHNEEDPKADAKGPDDDPYEDIKNDKHNDEDPKADAKEADDDPYEDVKNSKHNVEDPKADAKADDDPYENIEHDKHNSEDLKADSKEAVDEPYEDPLSHSSFSQKKKFFLKEIKASEEAAAKGKTKWSIDRCMFIKLLTFIFWKKAC